MYTLTAYCPCFTCSEGWGKDTKSGNIATENHTVAVDTNTLPLGTVLKIDGVEYVAEDVGGGVKGNHIDIYFKSHMVAEKFGAPKKEVFIKRK